MDIKMKKLILILMVYIFCVSNSNSESWFSNFKRTKILLGYENITINKNFYFDGYEIPGRESKLTVSTISVGLGVYLPVYEIADNLSIGISPQINIQSGGKAVERNNYPLGTPGSTNESGMEVLGFKFCGSVDLKYGGDASLKEKTNKFGIGVGIGYLYNVLFILNNNYQTPAAKAEMVYMFKDHLELALQAYLPFSPQKLHDDFSIYGYSVSFGLVGSFGAESTRRRR